MEQWNLYDKDGNLLENLHRRGDPLDIGFYHMVVSNWIKNDEGLYLIQKRNKPLREYINPWSVTAGAAIAGETNFKAVQRETSEEMGLDFDQEEFRLIERTFFDDFFMDVFETTWNGNASEIDFDPKEVTDVKWVTQAELQKMYKSKDFFDHKTEYLTLILDYSIV
jgi:8-oxo-dGTP pyrophosphatase MutT (NUDIX family)